MWKTATRRPVARKIATLTFWALVTSALVHIPQGAGAEDREPEYFRDRSTNQLIVGGTESQVDAWPWQVFLVSGNFTADGGLEGTSCGGVLIAEQWVITAAHCVMSDWGKPYEITVAFVGSNVVEAGEQLTAERVVVHPNYDDVRIENDLALLQLERPHTSDAVEIEVADAAAEEQYASNGTAAIATGWGALRDGEFLTSGKPEPQPGESGDVPTYLREVELELLDLAHCRRRPGGYEVSENMLCAVPPERVWRGTCSGDSGGPLVVEAPNDDGYILVGISSWVRVCGDPQYYSVFTRVSQYTDWIESTMRRF
jgi:secreted trypsin-like serine protease